jgi:hypothetical protein
MDVRAAVLRDAPDQATYEGTHTASGTLSNGDSIAAEARVRCTQDTVWASGELRIDGRTVFSQTWNEPLTREDEPDQ